MGTNNKKINEELTNTEVNKIIKVYMDKNEFKEKIEKIVKDRLKNDKEIEDKFVDISKNVLTQLFKVLWTKKSFWRDNLSNKNN
jgi:TusA-related sulfurtransferase